MRQVGTLPGREDASRFTAFLITEGISCKTEEENDGSWAVWVHDEKGVERAKDEFDKFVDDPANSRYLNLEAKAGAIMREEKERRTSARRNTVDVRTKWARPTSAARTPLTVTLIVLSVVVFFMTPRTTRQGSLGTRVRSHLLFADPAAYLSHQDPLASIKRGQLWRLVTPIFIHWDGFHLIFNMFMLFQLGRLLETRYGTPKLAMMVLLIAVLSNLAQAMTPESLQEVMGGGIRFGGMSGVVFGLFGFAWIRSSQDPARAGFMVPRASVFIMLGYLFLCMTPLMTNIANMAHLVGLVTGMLLALAASMS